MNDKEFKQKCLDDVNRLQREVMEAYELADKLRDELEEAKIVHRAVVDESLREANSQTQSD